MNCYELKLSFCSGFTWTSCWTSTSELSAAGKMITLRSSENPFSGLFFVQGALPGGVWCEISCHLPQTVSSPSE